MMPRFVLRWVSAALLAGFAFIEFARPVCIAQGAIELPGGENFKEMRITDGERFTFFQEGKPKSLEENVELKLIAASDEDKNATVRADKIEFFYAEDTGELARIVATGKVSFFVEPSRKEVLAPGDPQEAMELHGETVTWITSKNTVELQGNPRAEGEGWTLTGKSIVYDIEKGSGQVMKPRGSFVIPKKEDAKGEGGKEEKNKP
jgi:lipopolysaccharide transport protein LptA